MKHIARIGGGDRGTQGQFVINPIESMDYNFTSCGHYLVLAGDTRTLGPETRISLGTVKNVIKIIYLT